MRQPILVATAGHDFLDRWRGARPSFVCVLAHTDTCLIPGLSAAGVSVELRPLTPAADAEVVVHGAPRCLPRLPSNPLGAPGPAGITRAALHFGGIDPEFVGAGLRVWPDAPCDRLSETPGADITTGRAVPEASVLFDAGRRLGEASARRARHLVIGESVPGGTTTALALMLSLGYAAGGRVSGSMPDNAHGLKQQVACAALDAGGLTRGAGRADPLHAVACVGDPMQPVVAGMALAATERGADVLLAGGSQMLAVAALMHTLGGDAVFTNVAVGTTRWVVEDPHADVVGLAQEISSRLAFVAANLDFSHSRHMGLREYEKGFVKEGVGAGGACIAALLANNAPIEDLEGAIDLAYDGLVGRLT